MKKALDKLKDSRIIKWLWKKSASQKGRSGISKWAVGLGVGLVIVIALSFIFYKYNKMGKKIAKLKHERDLAEEKEHALNLKLDIEENDEEIANLLEDIDKYNKKIIEITYTLEELEEKRLLEGLKIDAIENWEEMDNYIKRVNDLSTNKDSKRRPN